MRSAAVLLAIAACVVTYGAAATDPLSAAQTASLHTIAATHPCTAIALSQVLREASTPQDGTLYLDEVPSSEQDPRAALESPGVGAQRNPYSSNIVFVRVHWRALKLPRGAFLLQFTSELIDPVGRGLQPRHLVETNIGVILSDRREIVLIEASAGSVPTSASPPSLGSKLIQAGVRAARVVKVNFFR